MKDNERLYSQWLDHLKEVPVSEAFPKKVMTSIHRTNTQPERNHSPNLPQCLHHPTVRWMAASGLVLLGLFRIIFVASSLFRANLVMP